MSTVKIYRDDRANAIFLEDANGVQFLNSLQATQNNTKVDIRDLAKNINLVSNTEYSNFVDENSTSYGSNSSEVTNSLNSIFASSGTPLSNLPEITSPTSINSISGEVINYEMTSNYGVGYEWNNLPSGLVTVEGNTRKLIGSLTSGVYTPTMKAVNYNGEDVETLNINVSNPPFANTKSINFVNFDYLEGNASSVSNIFSRVGNGSGQTDSWSISLYFKAGTSNNNEQTIFYYGDFNYFNGGTIQLKYNGLQDRIELLYGNLFNNIDIRTQNNSITTGQWQHLLIAYSGGSTGSLSGSVGDYYSRFKIFIDGTEAIYNNTNSNYGYNGSISDDGFLIGRYTFSDYMRNNCRVDEIAIWNSDQQLNVSSIYNSGTTFDLTTLIDAPNNWWRMGDGDTYPILQDNIGASTLIMTNMTSADIVNDVPQ